MTEREKEFKRAVARLAFAEAAVLRAQEKLRTNTPDLDYWEALYDWQEDEAYELVAALAAAQVTRDNMAREVVSILIEARLASS
jgi:hypothetical protein